MRAVRLDAPGRPLRVEDVPQPEPSGTEVRIRVAGCGVCHTDLHIVDGTQTRVELPLTLGHEVAGWIDAVGTDADSGLAAAGLAIGDAVVVHGGWGCGTCRECASGAEQRCADGRSPGFQADGGYAEMMLVPHPRHLVDLGGLDPIEAAPLADAGLTSYRAVQRARPWLASGARVLVVGAGGLGQFALQYLRLLPDVAASSSSSSRSGLRRGWSARRNLVRTWASSIRMLPRRPHPSVGLQTSSSTSSAATRRSRSPPRSSRRMAW